MPQQTVKMTVKDIVNKLIADEWIAEFTYEHMAYVLKGTARDSVERGFREIAKQEREHKQELIEWMQSKNYPVILNPVQMLGNCNPSGRFQPFTDPIQTMDALKLQIKSEINAKNMYTLYHQAVQSLYPDLAFKFMHIANEEASHKVQLEDLLSQV
jgi:rubrerythrin